MAATVKHKVQDVVRRLEDAVRALSDLEEYGCPKLKSHPPASAAELAKYEEYLEFKLPPTYRAFLEMHNGYDNLVHPGDMLSVQSVMPRGKKYKAIQEMKKMFADYGAGEILDGAIIAYLDQPNNWAYLDPNKPTGKGELTVVQWLSASTMEFPTLVEFFEYRITVCEYAKATASPNPDQPKK